MPAIDENLRRKFGIMASEYRQREMSKGTWTKRLMRLVIYGGVAYALWTVIPK